MRSAVDGRLRDEAARFGLRFACDDCCHHDVVDGRVVCSLAYPAELDRRALEGDSLAFCKAFELA